MKSKRVIIPDKHRLTQDDFYYMQHEIGLGEAQLEMLEGVVDYEIISEEEELELEHES